MDNGRERNTQGAKAPTRNGEFSRRAVVAGMVATAAVVATPGLAAPVSAQGLDPESNQDMMAFLLLCEALTGVDKLILAPELSGSDPGTDPINVKNDYFRWILAKDTTSSFAAMLAFAKRNPAPSAQDFIKFVSTSNNEIKFLARSIVLLWYLGSWYDPNNLQSKPPPVPSEVVSAKAYTQGLVWQIAGAHPMGYSNMQFGYWSRSPSDPNDQSPLLAPPSNS